MTAKNECAAVQHAKLSILEFLELLPLNKMRISAFYMFSCRVVEGWRPLKFQSSKKTGCPNRVETSVGTRLFAAKLASVRCPCMCHLKSTVNLSQAAEIEKRTSLVSLRVDFRHDFELCCS